MTEPTILLVTQSIGDSRLKQRWLVGPRLCEEIIDHAIIDRRRRIFEAWLQSQQISEFIRDYCMIQCCRYGWYELMADLYRRLYSIEERAYLDGSSSLLATAANRPSGIRCLLACLHGQPWTILDRNDPLLQRYPNALVMACLTCLAAHHKWLSLDKLHRISLAILRGGLYWLHYDPEPLLRYHVRLFPKAWVLSSLVADIEPNVLRSAVEILGSRIAAKDFSYAYQGLYYYGRRGGGRMLMSSMVRSRTIPTWRKGWLFLRLVMSP